MKLSLVIPCYNESKNIPLIFNRLSETLGARQDVEVLLVNNGSTDDSASVMEAEKARLADPRFKIVTVVKNQGYGFGILSGLQVASGDALGWLHADMQTDPRDALTAFDAWSACQPQDVIVKGKRKNRALLETLFTFGMQVIASLALGVQMDDINAQPKLFSRAFYDKHIKNDAPYDFSLDLYLLYQAEKNGVAIKTIPVYFGKRLHGEAKGGGSWKTRIKLIKRTFAYIFELRRKLKQ